MVFENGANEVRDLDLLLAQNGKCLVGEECQAYLQMSSIPHVVLTANQDRELHLHRSRRPLGVWSSDRYQNEARKLYFLFSKTVFVFRFSLRGTVENVRQIVTKKQI